MQNLVFFASGGGSNVQAIINYFRENAAVRVVLIVTNRAKAGVTAIAAAENIPLLLINRAEMESPHLPGQLAAYKPALLVLAGFLWKVPATLTAAYSNRIINIHPALLPKYGGAGMYGLHVHTAVLAAGERRSGISIHLVNEVYDAGEILLQAQCPVLQGDTAGETGSTGVKFRALLLPEAA